MCFLADSVKFDGDYRYDDTGNDLKQIHTQSKQNVERVQFGAHVVKSRCLSLKLGASRSAGPWGPG